MVTAAGAATLSDGEVRAWRMRSLLLDGGADRSVADVVTWMGAMQAQDLASGLWSLGMRIDGATQDSVTEALERREALRTWPMRGTVHLVPAPDARWMLDLMAAKPLAGAAARREYLGITEQTVDRANEALAAALAGGGRLTRAQCLEVIEDAGVPSPGQVGYHLLWYAAQVGLTCIAPNVGKEQTFVLLDEWVPDPVRLERDEALATIAVRYFRGHGPATVKDFARWTGLGMRDCRAGIAGAGTDLVDVTTEHGPMVAEPESDGTAMAATAMRAAVPPGFDEYMLGYGDRALLVSAAHFDAVVPGGNGVFRATAVEDGVVVATWKRTLRARSCVVEVTPLVRMGKQRRGAFDRPFATYGDFLGLPVEVRWLDAT